MHIFCVFFKDFQVKKVKNIAYFLDSKLAYYQAFSYINIPPKGGCYYINSNGNKTYVDRSFCGN